MDFMKKIFAFTLAETLIVMGIIGVVAALTLPNLNNSTGDKEKVVKVKKVYQNLTDAFGRAVAVYGPIDEWPKESSGVIKPESLDRIVEFLKISKDCGSSQSGCFNTNSVKSLTGEDSTIYSQFVLRKLITADGTSVLFYGPVGGGYYRILVDIDGPNKGSNTWGKDLFYFYISLEDNELMPGGSDYPDGYFWAFCPKGGHCITKWVIEQGNMDYLKCPDKLSATNTTCK